MKKSLLQVLLFCCLALPLFAPLLLAQELQLSSVIANVSVQPPSTVTFNEQRHSAMLKEPLLLTGRLEYPAAGYLRKIIEHPFEETIRVSQQQIEVTRDGQTQRLSLKSNRLMQTLLGGIEALLAGDTARLEKDFEPTLTGTAADWVLRLQPRVKRVAAHLQYIEVRGDAASVQSIRIQFDDQEWQLMELHTATSERP